MTELAYEDEEVRGTLRPGGGDRGVLVLGELDADALAGIVAAGWSVLRLERVPAADRPALAALERASRHLRGEAGCEHVAVLGVREAGALAFLLACTSSAADAVVVVDGALARAELDEARPFQPLEMALNLSCPFLLLHPEREDAARTAERAYAGEVLSQFARTFDIVARPGEEGDPLDRAALERVLAFLAESAD